MRLRLRIRLQNKLKSNNYSELAVVNGMASLIKMFMTYKDKVTKGIDIFNFFSGKENAFTQTQSAMNIFQSALNGTMQVKDGFCKLEKRKSRYSITVRINRVLVKVKDTFQWCLCKPPF